ncbi:programmed cell death 4 [Arctopsyche grandis]|uniref:programmed cell death 4 n=1 Tax=Arctopsyche grandis TaxID=121162 RepID=UPI00406D65FA
MAPPAVPAIGILEGRRRRARKTLRQSSREGAAPLPQHRSWKNSRRPRNGHGRGLPKKGGAGGKGVWGKLGSELLEEYEDFNDPNYDSETCNNKDIELKIVFPALSREDLQKRAEPIILEYFENADTTEALESFSEFISPNHRYVVCEIIVEMGLDHKPSHREMCSILISDFYGHLFSERDIAYAFENLLKNLDDMVLDQPAAAELLGNFIARCVADDCLPPKFLTSQQQAENISQYAKQALTKANTLLSMKHGLVRLDTIWGIGGGLRPVKSLVRQMNMLLKEYLSSGDVQEALRCVRDLEVPHFHHELVYETVVMALEAVNSQVEQHLVELLEKLAEACIVTTDMMERGFLRVFDDMADIVLDVPLAYITLNRFIERCDSRKLLTERIHHKMPTRGRKRFVSEGDGGHIKEHSLMLRD